MSALAPLLEAFFTERLIGQREASPHTVAAYRDAFCLLLRFAQRRAGRAPHQLTLEDLDAVLIGAFLDHLETDRGVSAQTRNARLTAIRSLFHFASYRHPEHAHLIQRVLAIPPRRTDKTPVTYLTDEEMEALLAAPDRSTWIGRRDHAVLLLLALETGLRGQRAHWAHVRDCPARQRRPCALPRQRTQRADHPAAARDEGGAASLARRTRRDNRRPVVPRTEGKAPQPRRRPASGRASRRHGSRGVPVARREKRHAAHSCATAAP